MFLKEESREEGEQRKLLSYIFAVICSKGLLGQHLRISDTVVGNESTDLRSEDIGTPTCQFGIQNLILSPLQEISPRNPVIGGIVEAVITSSARAAARPSKHCPSSSLNIIGSAVSTGVDLVELRSCLYKTQLTHCSFSIIPPSSLPLLVPESQTRLGDLDLARPNG